MHIFDIDKINALAEPIFINLRNTLHASLLSLEEDDQMKGHIAKDAVVNLLASLINSLYYDRSLADKYIALDELSKYVEELIERKNDAKLHS